MPQRPCLLSEASERQELSAAFTVGWHRPERFHKILTQNGSFVDLKGGGAYPALIRATEPKPLRVYLLSGTNDLDLPAGSWYEANNAMAAALESQGYAYRYRPGSGAHHPPEQAIADFPDALRWLWQWRQPASGHQLDRGVGAHSSVGRRGTISGIDHQAWTDKRGYNQGRSSWSSLRSQTR